MCAAAIWRAFSLERSARQHLPQSGWSRRAPTGGVCELRLKKIARWPQLQMARSLRQSLLADPDIVAPRFTVWQDRGRFLSPPIMHPPGGSQGLGALDRSAVAPSPIRIAGTPVGLCENAVPDRSLRSLARSGW